MIEYEDEVETNRTRCSVLIVNRDNTLSVDMSRVIFDLLVDRTTGKQWFTRIFGITQTVIPGRWFRKARIITTVTGLGLVARADLGKTMTHTEVLR